MVSEKKQKRPGVVRLLPQTAERVKRISFQASVDEGRRVTFAEIVERAVDALERELGKAPAAGKRKK